jgi:hypothetical protein
MALPRRTWRNPWLWPVTQLGVLLFPLVTAWRLGLEVGSQADAGFAGDLMLDMVVVWATLCGLLLGLVPELFVAPASRGDRTAMVTAVSRRMFAVLVLVPLSIAIVEPPDLLNPGRVWRQVTLLMAAVVVPTWAGMLLARVRGLGPVVTLVIVPTWGLVVIGGAVIAGRLAHLDSQALQTVAASAGVVGSIGLYLAVTETVTASLGRVLGAVALLAGALAATVTWWLAHPPLEMAWVVGPAGANSETSEIFIHVLEPNLHERIFSVDSEGTVTPNPYGVVDVEFLGRWQVMALLSPDLPLVPRTVRLCASEAGREDRCVAARSRSRGVHVDTHGSVPLVLMVTRHAIVVWNLETDAAWQVRRPDHRVRWPCFDEDGGLIWRLQTEEGPYRHERLDLAGVPPGDSSLPPEVSELVQPLPTDHGFQCRTGGGKGTVGRFVRGRKLVGRPHVLHGPGLPSGGAKLASTVGPASWSGDGRTFVYGIGRNQVRFYRPEFGLSAPVTLPNMVDPKLSPDGSLVAHSDGSTDGATAFVVRSVPDGAVVLRFSSEASEPTWHGSGHMLRVEAGRLLVLDARTGLEKVVFPPPTHAPVGP